MCGISGVASLRGQAIDPALLDAMSETLRHRGPDSGGACIAGPVGLAARRLAIIDISGGDQPIANEDGTIHVVQNGEIYNHEALRGPLETAGHRFRTRSDTEVLVHLYEAHGPAFAERLRGMFAVAIWDTKASRLVLARDRFGIKPLYYRVAGDRLAWGSELKALLVDPTFDRAIDPDALEAYLASNAIPAPLTIFKGARKLPAGHLLVWEADLGTDGIRIERYADVRPVRAEDVRTEDDAALADELRERLRDSVRAHLIADVPVGILLSGGIDSSALTALAAEATPEPVKTFSIGFAEREFSELDLARQVASRYGTEHHELVVRPNAVELLPKLVDAFDEPFADSSALLTYLVAELAARDVKVALSGEGGDELFGGYYTYVADLLAGNLGWVAPLARPFVERLPTSTGKVSFDYKAKRFVRSANLPPLERHLGWKEIFGPADRAALIQPDARGRADPVEAYRERYRGSSGAQPLARLQDVDLGVYLADDLLVKVDRTSMAHSLETRVPFLDPIVAALALALPDRAKVRGFAKKRLLRRAVAPLLPRAVVAAKKQGFSIPGAAWIRGELQQFVRESLSPEVIRRQGIFRPEAVTGLIDRHVAGREDLYRQIWNVLLFTLWFDRFAARTTRGELLTGLPATA